MSNRKIRKMSEIATIAAASAGAIVLFGAWPLASPDPEAARSGPSELERASGAIEFYEAKYAANRGHSTFGHKLIDFYSLRFSGAAEPGDLGRAEEIARELEARAPGPAERSAARARLSSLLLARHDFEAALAEAKGAVSDEASTAALGSLFDAALAVGEDSVALASLRRMEAGSVPWLIRASRVDRNGGRLDEALGRMGRAYRELYHSAAPRQTAAWAATMLGEIEGERSGPDAAARWYRRALEISPGYRGAIEGLAYLAYGREAWEEAEALYRRILAEAHPDLYLRLAEVLRARGETHEADELERRFLAEAERPGGEALYAHELALFHARYPATRDRALELACGDLARRSTAESRELVAWVHLHRGELGKALEASNRALEAGPPGPTGAYVRARVLEGLGRRDRAEALYASAMAEPTLLAPHALRDARERGLLGS